MNASLLKLTCVSRSFGSVDVLDGLSLDIHQGEFVAIVGPSGCGKTTLLNLLSGFDKPSSGTVDRSGTVRMIYQQSGLFPWKTAEENVRLGLRHLTNEAEVARQIQQLFSLIGLQGFGGHYPHQLSGGMQQRVELARALAGDSDLLLMDEPFSALDYITRLKMRGELARLLDERPRTVVLVTHDIEEAAQLADRVFVLSGRPAQVRREICIALPRPRDLTHRDVVKAIHAVLAELGLESNGEPARVMAHMAGGIE
jgi:ABC-type nitrate/sulfonate/bicarbonate transport system ATPase subunit